MHQLKKLIRTSLPLALGVAIAARSGAAQQETVGPVTLDGPASLDSIVDNVKELFSPDDEGGIGAGDKDSAFRQKLGPVVLRGDLKIVPSLNLDPRGAGDDELKVANTLNGNVDGWKDARKAGRPSIDVIAGGALDVDLGIHFEALSIEYKHDLLEKEPKKVAKPPSANTAAAKKSKIIELLSNDDLTVKIAGFTVRCHEDNVANEAAANAFTNGTLLKNGIKVQFWAGCVPIIVRGNAGMSLELNAGPSVDFEHMAFGAQLEPGVYAHGWLSAGIGGAVGPFSISAGVAAKLKLLDTTVKAEGGVYFDEGPRMYGAIGVKLEPATVEAQLFAQVQALCFSRLYTWTLFKASWKASQWQIGETPRGDVFPEPAL